MDILTYQILLFVQATTFCLKSTGQCWDHQRCPCCQDCAAFKAGGCPLMREEVLKYLLLGHALTNWWPFICKVTLTVLVLHSWTVEYNTDCQEWHLWLMTWTDREKTLSALFDPRSAYLGWGCAYAEDRDRRDTITSAVVLDAIRSLGWVIGSTP